MTDASTRLWQEKIRPLLNALAEHVTVEEMNLLWAEVWPDENAPKSVVCVCEALQRLRIAVELMRVEM